MGEYDKNAEKMRQDPRPYFDNNDFLIIWKEISLTQFELL